MDRLRSPGGCPWDGAQTHATLVPYLLEEAHELAEAVDADDRVGLREELGDVLLQVVFHARIAQEDPEAPFDLDDVADTLVAKLVSRHPHVFADAPVDGDLHAQWDRLKRIEKPERASALDGVPASLPALARAGKLAERARRAGLDLASVQDQGPERRSGRRAESADQDGELGRALLALVHAHPGADAEGALRRATRRWEAAVRSAEVRQPPREA
ncbi:MAG: MazG family protein [Actinobacteria bacterium]|nr:MazG family protein [Actinomycetota bacterium]